MRVVLNKCHGGFEISERCAEFLRVHGWDVTANEVNYEYDLDDQKYLRTHPMLIRAIEELGKSAWNEDVSDLKIIEVPNEVNWHIEDYDGEEWVAEDHRTWS